MEGFVKISFGMSEVLVISGALLYNSSMWISLTMIILGIICKVCTFSLEFTEKQEKIKKEKEQEMKNEKSINELKDSLLGIAALGGIPISEESH